MVSVSVVVTDFVAAVAVGVWVTSGSAKVIEPLSVSVLPSVIAPTTSTTVMAGASLHAGDANGDGGSIRTTVTVIDLVGEAVEGRLTGVQIIERVKRIVNKVAA